LKYSETFQYVRLFAFFSQLIEGYEQGITPNPDVLCNRHVKFGHLYAYATERLGADALATGHYACSTAGPYLEHLDRCSNGAWQLDKSTVTRFVLPTSTDADNNSVVWLIFVQKL
jgi:tRNA U34 2-thiouridine synthase MnmA/TrmU